MIILVQGNLIETESICMIGDIGHSILMDSLAHALWFDIIIINNNKVTVRHDCYSKDSKVATEEINALREKIVEIWTDNKGDIPRFDISPLNETKEE